MDELLCRLWSPEQVAARLARLGRLSISHETIYRHVWRDKRQGGTLHLHLRGARKRRRERYGAYDSRGRLAGKRMLGERPPEVEARAGVGQREADCASNLMSGARIVCKSAPIIDATFRGQVPEAFAELREPSLYPSDQYR